MNLINCKKNWKISFGIIKSVLYIKKLIYIEFLVVLYGMFSVNRIRVDEMCWMGLVM